MEHGRLDYVRLARAINVRDRSYALLMWISDAIDRDEIVPSRASHHSGGPAAATDWLEHNLEIIPIKIRPERSDIGEFGAFLSTYLTSSFDVIERPGTRGEGAYRSCGCDVCLRLVNAPHLQTKKLRSSDKRRAERLMIDSICDLADELRVPVSIERATAMLEDAKVHRAAAYRTYGIWLVKRLSGETDGPSILALWRFIAWDRRGGQIREFRLQVADFTAADERLSAALATARSGAT